MSVNVLAKPISASVIHLTDLSEGSIFSQYYCRIWDPAKNAAILETETNEKLLT